MATLALSGMPFAQSPPLFYEYNGAVIDWLLEHFPNGFGCPIRVEINSEVIAISELDREISGDDICVITPIPGTGAEIASYIIYAVISMAVAYVVQRVFAPGLPKAPGNSDSPQPNAIYSVSAAQENVPRVGEPIPVIYGEVLTTPDLAMQSYYAYTEYLIANPPAGGTMLVQQTNGHSIYFSQNYNMPAYYLWQAYGTNLTNWRLFAGPITSQLTVGLTDSLKGKGWDLRLSPSATDSNAPGYIHLPYRQGYDYYYFFSPQGAAANTITRELKNDGDQFLNQLFCVGCGEFEVITADRVKIGDTWLSEFDPANYSLLSAPLSFHGGQFGPITYVMNVTAHAGDPLYHENVITALEVGGQELTQLNDQTQFFAAGHVNITRIAVDILFPRGLFKIDKDDGSFKNISVQLRLIVQVQDSYGNWQAFTDRVVVFNNPNVKNVSPWRRSLIMEFGPGIYRVSVKRETAAAATDGSVADAVQWIGLRGYADLAPGGAFSSAYGNTHLIALRLKAAGPVSGAASTRIRARARRVLDVPASISPVTPGKQFTRNPVAHCYDIMTNTEYGGRRPSDEIDLDTFQKLYSHWAGYNGFNGAFTDAITIFEALTSVLQTVAASPLAIGGQISARWEGVKPYRLQLFSDANIVADSLTLSYSFDAVGAYDGVRVEYRDPDTWEPQFWTHPLKAVYPQPVNLFGCTDAATAVQMATFIYQWRRYQHKNIKFDIELEGNLVRPGARIAVQHQIITITAGGQVAEYIPGSMTITLDRPVEFLPGINYAVIFRNPDGTPGETRGATMAGQRQLLLSAPLSMPIVTALEDNPTLFAFGPADQFITDYLMDSATHSGGNVFSVEGTVYNEAAYQGAMPFLTQPVN